MPITETVIFHAKARIFLCANLLPAIYDLSRMISNLTLPEGTLSIATIMLYDSSDTLDGMEAYCMMHRIFSIRRVESWKFNKILRDIFVLAMNHHPSPSREAFPVDKLRERVAD